MERLTRRDLADVNGKQIVLCDSKEEDCNDSCLYRRCKWNEKALRKLKECEDAEEQGLLHKAPLKDGTPIFVIRTDWEDGDEVCEDAYLYGVTEYMVGEINKNYWLTKEEAEQALAKMKEV